MEELRNLEEVQRMLIFMHSRGVGTSSDRHSNRFLANLVLLLVQPCGELDLNQKFRLISEFVPKISVQFLDEATFLLSQESVMELEDKHRGNEQSNVKSNFLNDTDSSLQTNYETMAMVGLDAMQLANSTLEDFCRSYFMFHGMDTNNPRSIFNYLPVLSFTESYIYQLDSLNEKIVNMPTGGQTVLERQCENQSWISKCVDQFKTDPFKPLTDLLEFHGLLTERIREEFKHGEEYWALERKLCSALKTKEEISIEDVTKAIHLKSFDYRVLNLLLYQLRGEKVDDFHMEFLSISEFLVEVSDDLFDYEDDVLENNFNILRMLVSIYGPSRAPAMLVKYITEAEEKYNSLLSALDPELSSTYQRRCEEATREGGKVDGNPLGTWSIPPVIVNEELYRSDFVKL